jgi:beta-barrel assembly-enhancing protease
MFKTIVNSGLLSLFIIFSTDAQVGYTPIHATGKIPTEFITPLGEKYANALKNIDGEKQKFEKEVNEEFFLESNVILNRYYRTGRISFNDTITSYINRVADNLLQFNPSLRSQIKIYLIKSDQRNAFTFYDGTIFVTLGLIANIKNEAQLAYTLGHEITHFTQQHGLKGYFEQAKSRADKDEYKALNYDEDQLILAGFSKENELEADSKSLQSYFIISDYSTYGAQGIFDVLKESGLPFGNEFFDLRFFETSNLKFPEQFQLDAQPEIYVDDNYNDSLSTHPNIKKRKENFVAIASKAGINGKKDFILSVDEFSNAVKAARFELVHLYLQTQKYEQAIYASYLLLKQYPSEIYFEKAIGIAFLELAEYKLRNDFSEVHSTSKDLIGNFKSVAYFFEKLNEKELSVVALQHLLKLHAKYPKDEVLAGALERAFENVVLRANLKLDDFKTPAQTTWWTNVFNEYLNETFFTEKFQVLNDHAKKREAQRQELASNPEKRKAIAEANKEIKKNGFALGIDRIVVVNPFSRSFSENKVLQADKIENELSKALVDFANSIDLKVTVLDLKSINADDIDKFNDYCKASNWFNEITSLPETNYYCYNRNFVYDLVDKYQTRYFAWVGIFSDTQQITRTIMDFYLFDIMTGEIKLSQRALIPQFEDYKSLKANLGKILRQVKQTRVNK